MTAVEHVRDVRTGRWLGVAGAALAAGALGTLVGSAGLVLLAGLGVTILAYSRVARPPQAALELDRRVEPAVAEPGEPVTVATTVRNVGDRTVPDLRLVDGVPDGVDVVDGPPRLGAALGPGSAATVVYRVEGRGTHRFEPARAALRDVAGVVERRVRVTATGDAVSWRRAAGEAAVPVRPDRTRMSGRVSTTRGGEGVAFHSVREYHPGDSSSRIDWHRLARTGELASVTYQDERSDLIVILIDARAAAALAPPGESETAVDRSVRAADALVDGLAGAGHAVGLAALAADAPWIPPGRGRPHRRRIHDCLSGHAAFAGGGPVGDPDVEGLLARIPARARVLVLSPLCDDRGLSVARRLLARGHAVTVVSPDPTAADTPGRRIARLERRERLRTLRAAGADVHDWAAGRPLGGMVARAGGKP